MSLKKEEEWETDGWDGWERDSKKDRDLAKVWWPLRFELGQRHRGALKQKNLSSIRVIVKEVVHYSDYLFFKCFFYFFFRLRYALWLRKGGYHTKKYKVVVFSYKNKEIQTGSRPRFFGCSKMKRKMGALQK